MADEVGVDEGLAAFRVWWGGLPAQTKGLLVGAVGAVVGVVVLVLSATGSFPTAGGGGGTTSTSSSVGVTTSGVPLSTGTTGRSSGSFGVLDNPAGMPLLGGDLTQAELEFGDGRWTEPFSPADNGGSSQGQFRLICSVAGWRPDDPIVFPGEPGRSHLHMFFGNSEADADSTADTLLNGGGSTCQAGPLNRSAYWIPAMLDGDGGVVVPKAITLYYKTRHPDVVVELPQGLEMIAGAVQSGGVADTDFGVSEDLSWGCYNPVRGLAEQLGNRIPGAGGAAGCGGRDIQATIQFPQCFADDGTGNPVLGSADHLSHMWSLSEEPRRQLSPCPPSHPVETVQISYLIRWADPSDTTGWRLSCDPDNNSDGQADNPGGCLHGDWLGAWNDQAIRTWYDGCIRRSRNCSLGQTGTARRFRVITGDQIGTGGNNQLYVGPQVLQIPD